MTDNFPDADVLRFLGELFIEPNHLHYPGGTTFVYSRSGRYTDDSYPLAHADLLNRDEVWVDFAAGHPDFLAVPGQGMRRRKLAAMNPLGLLGRINALRSPHFLAQYQERYGRPMPQTNKRLIVIWDHPPALLHQLLPGCLKHLVAAGKASLDCVVKSIEFPCLLVRDAIAGRMGPKAAANTTEYKIGGTVYTWDQLVDIKKDIHVKGLQPKLTPFCHPDAKRYPAVQSIAPFCPGEKGVLRATHPARWRAAAREKFAKPVYDYGESFRAWFASQ